MKIERKTCFVFDDEETKALQTIADIDCSGIDCHRDGCPFDYVEEKSCHCIKGMLKEMMMKQGISF